MRAHKCPFTPHISVTATAGPGQSGAIQISTETPASHHHHLLPPSVCVTRKLDWRYKQDSIPGNSMRYVGIPNAAKDFKLLSSHNSKDSAIRFMPESECLLTSMRNFISKVTFFVQFQLMGSCIHSFTYTFAHHTFSKDLLTQDGKKTH